MIPKVLLPLDGSRRADCIIDEALKMAKNTKNGIAFILMQVIEIYPLLPRDKESEMRILTEHAEKYLSNVKKRFEEEGIKNEIVIKDGKPAQEICDYADSNDVDFVVISSHGLGGVNRWALGSVTDKVVRHCSKPVYVVKNR